MHEHTDKNKKIQMLVLISEELECKSKSINTHIEGE